MFIESNVKKINFKLALILPIVLAVLLVSITITYNLANSLWSNVFYSILLIVPFLGLVIAGITFTVLFAKKGYLIFTNEKITDQKFNWKKYLLISIITGLACLLTPIFVIFLVNILSSSSGFTGWNGLSFASWIREFGWNIAYLLFFVTIVSVPIASGLMLYFYLTFKIIKVKNAKKSSLNSNTQLNN